MAKFVRVRYMNLRTGEEFTEEFARYGKLMGPAAWMGMKRLYGPKWKKRYRIIHIEVTSDEELITTVSEEKNTTAIIEEEEKKDSSNESSSVTEDKGDEEKVDYLAGWRAYFGEPEEVKPISMPITSPSSLAPATEATRSLDSVVQRNKDELTEEEREADEISR